jgi:hypothetical protein
MWLIGCGKKPAADTTPPPTQAAVQPAETQSPAPDAQQAQATTAQAPNAEPPDLNRELRKWILRNRRPPKDFDDFSSTAGIDIPPPPDGKKYAIDKTMHVVLVKR